MSKEQGTPAPADLEAYKAFQDALSAVLAFPETTVVPGFVTLEIKQPIHDNSGNEIPAQLHFMNENGALYAMTIEGKTETGLKGQLVRYNSTTGGAFTLSNLIGLILADKALAPLIDAEAARDALNRLSEAAERESREERERSAAQLSLFPEDELEQELQEEILEALPRLKSILPQKHVMPNNKLANSLTLDIIDNGTIELDVGRKKGEIITRCILSYEGDNIKLLSRRPFTEYDSCVLNSATSLYVYGDESHVITAATVYRAMVHATETETPSPQQIGAVTRSLDKMRFIRVQVDCTEELTRRKLSLNGEVVTGGKIDDYLLPLKKIEIEAGGKKVAAYRILSAPILYGYSQLTGQVLTTSSSLLDIRDDTGAKVANTERRIAIKEYLLRRVCVMKGPSGKRQSKHILYDTVYQAACMDSQLTRKDQQTIRDYIDLVLQSWKRAHFIKGYTVLTQGRKKIGVEITT